MAHPYSGPVIGVFILAIVVIVGVLYFFAPFLVRYRLPVLIVGIILILVFLVASGSIGAWRRKYREMGAERRKRRIKNGIDGITREIHGHLDHINADEAVRLTSEAYRCLDEGDFKRAIESIKEAQKLVETTLDTLSFEARDFDARADAQFKEKKYAGAHQLWSQSLDVYDMAEKFARHANDTTRLDAILTTKETIRGRIRECKAARDRLELAKSVEVGDRKMASADRHLRAGRFDDAKNEFGLAKEHFGRVRSFAGERGLTSEQLDIEKKISRADAGIESVAIDKAHAIINEGATASANRKYLAAENYYSLAIRLLEESTIKKVDVAALLKDAKRGLVTARLEQGKEMMRKADLFYAKRSYVEAKEAYDAARDHIKETGGLASLYNLSALHAVLIRLGETCAENSEVATAAILDTGIATPAITPVDSVEHAPPVPVRLVRARPVPPPESLANRAKPETLPPELVALYPEWMYLGKGGFARVFRAKRADGTAIVIKIPIFLDTLTGKTFIAEMQTWKKLSHPNIVKLYDFNIMPIPYIEEELCDSTLAEMKKPVEPEEAAWILFNICEGLKFAHAQKIVHRDLKPGNILLKDGVPKISDWGLSRVLTEVTTATSMAFTLTYAAPEQINGSVKDERTDIWQLGVIFYELLTNELPFGGESMIAIRKNIATKEPRPPGDIQPGAKVLDPVVMQCLKKDPRERYQSVSILERALARYLQISYTESLKISTTAHDYSRAAHLTGALVLTHLRTGDLANAYNYLQDLTHYAHGDVKSKAQELSEQVELRMEMGLSEIPEELIQKAESIIHEIDRGVVSRDTQEG
jgi:tetratricopeptide (TPR) repeat protein